jgi:effector-binding domain-containing protein
MDYAVRVEEVAARELAAVRGVASRAELGTTIVSLLDQVWAVLREQKVRTGHNVVVYHDGVMNIDAGVEIFTSLDEVGGVRVTSTPAGPAATTAHFGDYSGLGNAYAAVNRWCADNRYHPTGPSWEVYGDWQADPRQVRTDVYLLVESGRG